MNTDDLLTLVRRMRAAQRDFFSTWDRVGLDLARRLEREVDHELNTTDQGILFEGPE